MGAFRKRDFSLTRTIIIIGLFGLLFKLYYAPVIVLPQKHRTDIAAEESSSDTSRHQACFNITSKSTCPPCRSSRRTSGPYHQTNRYHLRKFLRGKPTPSFRDNLRPEVSYITAWHTGGFTNDVMGISNLLYLAQMTERVPILPPFAGFRDQWQAGFIPFGEIFDVPRLREALHMPIIEWRDVKDLAAGSKQPPEPLGCWSVWAPYDGNQRPRGNFITGDSQLSLDLSYTPVMDPVKLMGMNEPHEPHVNLNKLATLSHHDVYLEVTRDHKPVSYPSWPNIYPPDEHVMCIDFLYWASILKPFEWETSYSPGWKIAKHLRWTPKLTSIAQEYLMRLFKVPYKEDVPPFISIHVRRRDFADWCDRPLEDCFAPLEAFEVRVREIQAELQSRLKNEAPLRVVITSDERDPAWWETVRERGWLFVDHGPNGEATERHYGSWYLPLLDAVIQSEGIGFVGTDRSTMSILSRRRVEEWHGGVTRMVKWGFPGADDH